MTDVFLKLLNMSITAGYLILVIVVLRLVFRRAPRWFFCALWCLVGLRLVCPISLESPWSLIPSTEPVSVEWLAEQGMLYTNQGAGMDNVQLTNQDIDAADVQLPNQDADAKGVQPANQSDDAVGVQPTNQDSQAGAVQATNPGSNVASTEVSGQGKHVPDNQATGQGRSVGDTKFATIFKIITTLWLAGAAVLLTYTLVTYLRLKLHMQDAVRLQDNLFQSEKVNSPFVLGFFKPCIYLPYHMEEESLNCVIAHEQAHIKRGDHISKLVGFLLLAVYWFQPLVWLAYILFCRDMEFACDERVLKDMDIVQRKNYSKALLNCSVSHRNIAACPIAFGEVGVKERIRNILNYRKASFWIVVLCILLGALVIICFVTNPTAKGQEEGTSLQADADNPPPLTGKYLAANGGAFDYCFELSGDLPNSQSPLTFTVYTNDADITFEKVVEHYFGMNEDTKYDMYVFCPNFVAVKQEQDVLDEKVVLVSQEKIFDYTIVNNNTGEEIAFSAFDFSKTFEKLNQLYTGLKFEEAAEQRSLGEAPFYLQLYDLDGKLLQTVAPYVDGVEIDGVFYECSLNQTSKWLFTYLDVLFALKEEGQSLITNVTKEQGTHVGTGLIIGDRFEEEVDTIEGVELSISEWAEDITLRVSNETDKKVLFGESFSMQIELNGEWHYLQPMNDNVVFSDEGHYAPNEVTTEYNGLYGILPPGRIRFVKSVSVYENSIQHTNYLIATEEFVVITHNNK